MKIITANRLTDGRVVYLRADRQWSEKLADAAQFDADAASTALEAAHGEGTLVVGPYLIEVDASVTPITQADPKRLRESVRTNGPSAGTEHGQAWLG